MSIIFFETQPNKTWFLIPFPLHMSRPQQLAIECTRNDVMRFARLLVKLDPGFHSGNPGTVEKPRPQGEATCRCQPPDLQIPEPNDDSSCPFSERSREEMLLPGSAQCKSVSKMNVISDCSHRRLKHWEMVSEFCTLESHPQKQTIRQ
jgi:hypothetical protein